MDSSDTVGILRNLGHAFYLASTGREGRNLDLGFDESPLKRSRGTLLEQKR